MKRKLLIIQILVSFVGISCQMVNTTSLPGSSTVVSSNNQVQATSTALIEVITSLTPPSAFGVEEDVLYLKDIDPGQYLLVQKYEAGIPYLVFVDAEKNIEKEVSEDAYFWSTSIDGTRLLMMNPDSEHIRHFSLVTKVWANLKFKSECYEASLPPDEYFVSVSCGNGSTLDIYILDVNLNSITKVTNCLEADVYCDNPSWSRNGDWLAYSRNEIRSGNPSLANGVYMFNITCIHDNSCMSEQIGPIYSDSNPTWSIENSLIVSKGGNIQFYDAGNNPPLIIREFTTDIADVADISISPDGKYLVYAPAGNKAIHISQISDDQLIESEILLEGENITIVGWLVIP